MDECDPAQGGFHAMYNTPFSEPDPPIFRNATFADMPHVWRIVYHAYSAYIPILGRTPPTFQEDFDSHVARGNLWLYEKADGVHAMAVLTPMLDHVLVQALCVDPSFQGRGLGREMLAFAELHTASLGFDTIRLYTNSLMVRNVKIYRKWGFKIYKREENQWGQRIHMRKTITSQLVAPLAFP